MRNIHAPGKLATVALLVLMCAHVPRGAAADTHVPPSCLSFADLDWSTKHFAFEGRCRTLEQGEGCYFYDYRRQALPDRAGVDQRGITAYQVSFPQEGHRWAALAIGDSIDARFCWVGGAVVGRNPLAMTWGGLPGGKLRKNNFLQSEGGTLQVERARVHNTHDTFIPKSPDAGFDIRESWISRTRDDFVEGRFGRLRMSDTLLDGTYSFLSSPDDCTNGMSADGHTVVIENSLIRLQRQPGPYARDEDKWHASVDGGHGRLWKLDDCGWEDWPRFVLRNNVFLIEGPQSTSDTLFRARCNHALPGACDDNALSKLQACENNLFLYTDYHHWTDSRDRPGPAPTPGNRFHNPENPHFLPNGRDCYQRITDDPRDPGYGDPLATWSEARDTWLDRHASGGADDDRVMRIAGVDHTAMESGRRIRLRNRESGLCLESSAAVGVRLDTCSTSATQVFEVVPFDDGVLDGALLLRDHGGAFLGTQPAEMADGAAGTDRSPLWREPAGGRPPSFAERWYLLPLAEEPGGCASAYAIESDMPFHSFVRGGTAQVEVQRVFEAGTDTGLPQATFASGDDSALQWIVVEAASGVPPRDACSPSAAVPTPGGECPLRH